MTPPTIDGALNDAAWNLANVPELLTKGGIPELYGEDWSNYDDNKVQWRAVWSLTENMLYLAIEIQDDIAGANDHPNNELWQDDCIQIFIDGDRSGGEYMGESISAQGWLIRRDNSKALNWASGQNIEAALVTAVQQTVAGNWVLEIAMQVYSQFDIDRKQLNGGDIVGWDIWYDDSDNKQQDNYDRYQRDVLVGWGYSGPVWHDADYMHELELGADPNANNLLINVTFFVNVPEFTPSNDIIYITGTFNYWDPGPGYTGSDGINHDFPLMRVGDNLWQLTLPFLNGEAIEYKYTRGNWETVEKGVGGEEIPDRQLTVPPSDHIQNDSVLRWRDIPVNVESHTDDQIPDQFFIGQNYPNPFNPKTTIRFDLPKVSRVILGIYNLQGQEIDRLVDGVKSAGRYSVVWDGKDGLGRQVPSGVYVYHIRTTDFSESHKMVLSR